MLLICISHSLLRRTDCRGNAAVNCRQEKWQKGIYCRKQNSADDLECDRKNLGSESSGDKKKEHPLKGRKKSALQRLRMSQSHKGKKHSAETREKIRQSMLKYKREQKGAKETDMFQRLQTSLEGKNSDSNTQQQQHQDRDYFVMEKAVLELSQLRREVSIWLEEWYEGHERKPTLDEVAQLSPEVHNKFLRYIALQDFIRSNS